MIKSKLIDKYVALVVEKMDLDDVILYTTEGLTKYYSTFSKKALLEEIKEREPTLWEQQ
jgi:hypothetical protein